MFVYSYSLLHLQLEQVEKIHKSELDKMAANHRRELASLLKAHQHKAEGEASPDMCD